MSSITSSSFQSIPNTNVSGITSLTNVTTPLTINDVDLAYSLVNNCISVQRVTDYTTWINLGICLKNIDTTLINMWIDISRQSDNFESEQDCIDKWSTFEVGVHTDRDKKRCLGMGSLRMWAKMDNPVAYDNMVNDTLQGFLHKCLSGTHTDMAIAVEHLFSDEFVCVSFQNNVWYRYDGNLWRLCPQAFELRYKISRNLHDALIAKSHEYGLRAASSTTDDEKKHCHSLCEAFKDIAKTTKNTRFKDCIVKECAEILYDGSFLSNLDANNHLIGFENGVYDLNQGQFRQGVPSDKISISTGYNFVHTDDITVQEDIMRFIKSIQATEEMAQYLLDVISYMLDGNKFMEYMWFLTGSQGRNGKSVLAAFIDKTFGGYSYMPRADMFTTATTSSGGPSSELAKMKGKRFVCASEPDDTDGSSFKVSRLKNWRGNDKLQARALYQEAFEFNPQFAIMILMNDMPSLDKVDRAFASTLKVINFPFTFTENPINPNERLMDSTLKNKFTTNPAYCQQFMRILVKNYKDRIDFVNRKHIKDPIEVRAATDDYIDDNNDVGTWALANYEKTELNSDRIKAADVYQHYYDSHRMDCMNAKMFHKNMAFNGFLQKKVSVYLYVNMKRKAVTNDEETSQFLE
jgi:P4 family phage/plasmid primase-like protien